MASSRSFSCCPPLRRLAISALLTPLCWGRPAWCTRTSPATWGPPSSLPRIRGRWMLAGEVLPLAWLGWLGVRTTVRRGCLCPLLLPVAAARAPAAHPSAVGPPVSHGGYAGGVMGGSAPIPAEAAGHEARARAASRSLERSRPPAVLPSSGSRGEERERSPRGTSALAAALAAAAAAAEAEFCVSTDDYMPDAEPDADAGNPPAPRSASSGSRGSIGELRIKAASAAAILRVTIGARGLAADVEAARADADAAQAAVDAALAAPIAAPVWLLPRGIKPIYKAPPPEAMAPPQAAKAPPLAAAGAAASAAGLAAASDVPAGDDAAAPMAPVGAAVSPGDAAAVPVPEPSRVPAARRPSKGGKGGKEGKGDEVDARLSFLESALSQADAGATLDGRSLAAPGYSGDADDSAGSDI